MMIHTLDAGTLVAGCEWLATHDSDLARVYATLGPPPLWARPAGFATLVHIILEQQVSLASARATNDRLVEACGGVVTPEALLRCDDAEMKQVGFSRQKTRYSRALAEAVLRGTLELDALAGQADDVVEAKLTAVVGIGRWTSDIYRLMVLLRPDVWPRGDIALHAAMREVKGLVTRPNSDAAARMASAWQPWRAVAARLLWHHYLSTPRKRA